MTEHPHSPVNPGPPSGRPPVNPAGVLQHPPPPYGASPPPYGPPPQRGGGLGRILGWSLSGFLVTCLIGSVLCNVYMVAIVGSLASGPRESVFEKGRGPHRIVILPVEGSIDEGTYDFVRQSFLKLRDNPPAALILRVNSPGGFVGPSDRILAEVKRFKEHTGIPVVGSFGSVAASGGYYVAADCDWIVAEATCTTGSIGVMAMAFTFEGTLDKLGVTSEVATAREAPMKDVANNIFRPWGEADRDKLKQTLDHAHDRFVEVVFEGRMKHLQSKEKVRELANGETYTCSKAIELKLVDGEGYIYDAIEKAKELANLSGSDRPNIKIMRPARQLGVLGLLGASGTVPHVTADQIRQALYDLASPRLEYR